MHSDQNLSSISCNQYLEYMYKDMYKMYSDCLQFPGACFKMIIGLIGLGSVPEKYSTGNKHQMSATDIGNLHVRNYIYQSSR